MSCQQKMDDQQLVRMYMAGNEQSLETLVNRHKTKLYQYIFNIARDKELAEDIFQETFFKVINTLKRGAYNEEGKFLPWVERIAHNLLIDFFRKNKRMPTISGVKGDDGEFYDIFDLIQSDEKNIEQKILQKQMDKRLKKLVATLPADQREVLMMRHYYDMSFKEIAETTNVSINTALGRMRYAIMNLRKMMNETYLVEL